MPSISLPAAIAIGGGLSAAGGVASGVIGAGAASSASKAQVAAAQQALQQQKEMYGDVKNELNPFLQAGESAIPGVQGLLGISGAGGSGVPNSDAMMKALQGTPGYQFTLNQGLQATQSGFAAQGLAESGPALKGAAAYAEGLAGTTYQQQLSNYLGLMGQGQNAASALAGFGLQSQQSSNALLQASGQSQASGIVGSANAITGGIGSATGALGNTALLLGAQNSGLFGGTSGNSANPFTAAAANSANGMEYNTA